MTISDKKRYIKKECVYKLPWNFETDADFIEYFFWLNGKNDGMKVFSTEININIVEIRIIGKYSKEIHKAFICYMDLPISYKKFVNAVVNVLYKLIKYLEG